MNPRKRRRSSSAGRTRVRDITHGSRAVSVKNAKAVKTKGVKKVKVSSELKDKILKVVEKKVHKVRGSYTANHTLQTAWGNLDRQQNVLKMPGFTGWSFTTNWFLNCASVLFNKKSPPTGVLPCFAPLATNSFDQKYFMVTVKDSYTYYTFKNSSQHAVQITLCVCVPKKKGPTVEWIPDTPSAINKGGITSTVPDAYCDADAMWRDAIEEDVANGYLLLGFQPPTVAANPSSITPPTVNDMWRRPDESPTFRNMWKTEFVTLKLQPGEVISHKIQGPQGVDIDYAKLYVNDTLQNVQKYSRFVFAIMVNEPNMLSNIETTSGTGSGATPGRWADKVDLPAAGFGVLVERTEHVSLAMPEQTGFSFPGGTPIPGQPVQLDLRRTKSIQNNYFFGHTAPGEGRTAEVIDLSVMNPQAPVTNAPTGGS